MNKNRIMLKLAADDLILQALKEDITSEDITTNAIVPEGVAGQVELICKQDGVLAGIDVYARVFELLDAEAEIHLYAKDGEFVRKGTVVAVVRAQLRALLSGERTALNYLQRMSGIATITHDLCSILAGTKTRLLDTRKTTPNMRLFEKYAVRIGGGTNHRFNLSDGILIKDNHIAAAGSITRAVALAREYAPFVRKIEVEVESLEMLNEALCAKAEIIMLDNMSTEQMKEAIQIIDGRAETECSGNVTKERLQELASIGLDYISCGALTHSASIIDFSMKNLKAIEAQG